jgi:hypothetical protein
LCLEWRADNWERHVTGADLVKRTSPARRRKHPSSPARPVRALLTEGQKLRRRAPCLHRSGGTGHIPNNPPQPTEDPLYCIPATVAFISKLEAADGEMVKIDDLPSGISYFPLFACPKTARYEKQLVRQCTPALVVDELSKLLAKADSLRNGIVRDATRKTSRVSSFWCLEMT